jgi:hypothetical protein
MGDEDRRKRLAYVASEVRFTMASDLDLNPTAPLFPLEELDEALILIKEGKLDQTNAVFAFRA